MNPLDGLPKTAPMAQTLNGKQVSIQEIRKDYQHPPDAIRKKLKGAAQDLEGFFLQQLLTQMDKTVHREEGLLSGGKSEETFREMLNTEIAKSMAHRPGGTGFGLAEQIYQQTYMQHIQAQSAPSGKTPDTANIGKTLQQIQQQQQSVSAYQLNRPEQTLDF